MMGRYPGDVYGGDNDQSGIDHLWAICTCNFAEPYYRLANQITAASAVPLDANSAEFFNQVGVTASSTPAAAATELRAVAGVPAAAVGVVPGHHEPGDAAHPARGIQIGLGEGE